MALLAGFAGYSGSGKTTLICKILPRLGRTLVVKHAHHPLGQGEENDGRRYLAAGAEAVLLIHPAGACMETQGGSEEIDFSDLSTLRQSFPQFDAILIEGWKHRPGWPRVIVNRDGVESLSSAPDAVAEVCQGTPATELPVFREEQIDDLTDFLDRITA